MSELRLHLAKGTVALAPHIALNETNASYELSWVDFSKAEQTQDAYLDINPKGRVPALETKQGILTETAAMLNYISACHPEAALTPQDPWERAKMEELFLFLAATVHINHAHKMRGHRWSDDPDTYEAMQAKVAHNISENAALIEEEYLAGPFVMGDQFTSADIYLFTIARWFAGDGADMSRYPRLSAFLSMIAKRPSVASALKMHI